MKRSMIWLAVAALVLCLAGLPAFGDPTPMFTECPQVGPTTGCQVLITINAGDTLSYQLDPSEPSFNSFGNGTLVGVLNDSGALQYSITLSGSNIFDFADIGACSGDYTPSPSGCPNLSNAPTSYEGYDKNGNFDSFSPTGLNSGMIYFSNGLTAGDSAFFSLAGSPQDINGVPAAPSTVPEPASVLLIATGLLFLFLVFKQSLRST